MDIKTPITEQSLLDLGFQRVKGYMHPTLSLGDRNGVCIEVLLWVNDVFVVECPNEEGASPIYMKNCKTIECLRTIIDVVL